MKYNHINSMVPEGEFFDETAVNEGVWLTEGHLHNMEMAFSNNQTEIAGLQQKVQDAALAEQQAAAMIMEANQTIESQRAEIEALKSEIEALKKKPAADFSETKKERDAIAGTEVKEISPITREANEKRKQLGLPEIY
jgi:chromosome segregation ATPase